MDLVEVAPRTGSIGLRPTQVAYLPLKRAADVVVGLILLVLSAPLLAIFALLIVAEGRGGPIFRQQRIGKDGGQFTIYKLRSMTSDTPPYAYKIRTTDPRVTRVGRFLRLSGLDELPQLVNVVRGELSLIGPRPEMPFIARKFESWQLRRQLVRPGITGSWQVHHAVDEPLHLGVGRDLEYIERMGPIADLAIVARTVWVILVGSIQGLQAALR